MDEVNTAGDGRTAQVEPSLPLDTPAPRVFNSRNGDAPPGSVYVGRGSPWGNPFVIGKDGGRDEVIARFRDEVLPTLDVSKLRGRNLICFCAPLACHADLLLGKANAD